MTLADREKSHIVFVSILINFHKKKLILLFTFLYIDIEVYSNYLNDLTFIVINL